MSDDEIVLVQPGLECGEVCVQPAAVELVDGGFLYCWECLARIVRVGIVFEAAMAEATKRG